MDQVTQFHDVSNWEGDYQPSGPLFAKATQGASFVDKYYARNRDRTLAGHWPFAAYHYLDTRARPQAQADHVLEVVGKFTPVMWDIEKGGGTVPQLLTLHDAYVAMGGHARLVYLPHWYWAELGEPDLQPLVDRGLLLVASNYPPEGYTNQGPGWHPYGRMTPMFWQWTDHPIDTVAYRGTPDQLARLLAGRAIGAQSPNHPPVPHPNPPPAATVPDHIVRPGDTLWSISRAWDVTLESVEKANPDAGHPRGHFAVIWPGDRIKHP